MIEIKDKTFYIPFDAPALEFEATDKVVITNCWFLKRNPIGRFIFTESYVAIKVNSPKVTP